MCIYVVVPQVGFPLFPLNIPSLSLCWFLPALSASNSAYSRAQTLECVCFPAAFTTLKIWSSLLTLDTISEIRAHIYMDISNPDLSLEFQLSIQHPHWNISDRNLQLHRSSTDLLALPAKSAPLSHPHFHGWKFWLYSHASPRSACAIHEQILMALCLKTMPRIWHFVPLLLLPPWSESPATFPWVAGKASCLTGWLFCLTPLCFPCSSQSEAMKSQMTSFCSAPFKSFLSPVQ